jgi:hypothetical protein
MSVSCPVTSQRRMGLTLTFKLNSRVDDVQREIHIKGKSPLLSRILCTYLIHTYSTKANKELTFPLNTSKSYSPTLNIGDTFFLFWGKFGIYRVESLISEFWLGRP